MSSTAIIDVSTGFSGLATERLEAELCGMAANIAAATCRWLEMVAEYDKRQAWVSWECRSMTHWLVGHVGMARSTAREHVRVANALTTLPKLRAEFGVGRLSYSRVRTVSRVATRANEEGLLSVALAATAPQLERWVNAIERAHMANDPDAADQSSSPGPSLTHVTTTGPGSHACGSRPRLERCSKT